MFATKLSGDSVNLGEEIVLALKRYGRVPVEFLVRLTGRSPSTVEEYVTALEERHVVKRQNEQVMLEDES